MYKWGNVVITEYRNLEMYTKLPVFFNYIKNHETCTKSVVNICFYTSSSTHFYANKYLENYIQDMHRNTSTCSCEMVIKIIQYRWKLKELSSRLQNSSVSDFVKLYPAVLKILDAFRQKDTLYELKGCSAGFWLLLKVKWMTHKQQKTHTTGIELCSLHEVPILYLILS
jgi:hypothetical protein